MSIGIQIGINLCASSTVASASLAAAGNSVSPGPVYSYTAAGVSIGDAPESGRKRFIVVVTGKASALPNEDTSTSGLTIGGISATKSAEILATSASYKQYNSVHILEHNSGATADIVVTTANQNGTGLQVYAVYMDAALSLSLFDTSSDEASTALSNTVDIPAGPSVVIVAAGYRNGEATPSISFGGTMGVSTDFRADILTNENFYSGSLFVNGPAEVGKTITISDPTADGGESVSLACVFQIS